MITNKIDEHNKMKSFHFLMKSEYFETKGMHSFLFTSGINKWKETMYCNVGGKGTAMDIKCDRST